MTRCDLFSAFGCQYVVEGRNGDWYRVDGGDYDPQLLRIPCEHGYIHAVEDGLLRAVTKTGGVVADKLLSVPNVQLIRNLGPKGVFAVFDAEQLPAVAEVMKAKQP